MLLQGHSEGELNGLAANPSEAASFITASADKTLRVWDIVAKVTVNGRLMSIFGQSRTSLVGKIIATFRPPGLLQANL